jgi:hypothetical protein
MRLAGLALASAALLSGSALAGEEAAKPDPRIGAEVDKICFARDINGWKEIEGEDNVVLLEEGVNDWYRVELAGGCPSRLFRFAHWIGIDQRPSGGCVRSGDTIIVRDGANFTRRCHITRINEWNDDLPPPTDEPGETEEPGAEQ